VLVRHGLIKEGINSLLSQVCLNALSLLANLAGSMLDLNSCCFLCFIESGKLEAHNFPYSYFTRVSIDAVLKYAILRTSRDCTLPAKAEPGSATRSPAIFAPGEGIERPVRSLMYEEIHIKQMQEGELRTDKVMDTRF